jgi:hypothetical protein
LWWHPLVHISVGDNMTSQVFGVPLCPHAPLYDPDGASAPDPCDAAVLPSALPIALASIFVPFEARSRGLLAPCVRFAA